MNNKIFKIVLVLIVTSTSLIAQEINGLVIDSESELPLAYVNVGVINTPKGTISNDHGEYTLNCKNLPADCKVQISMIGYESQTFGINDLKNKTISLTRKPIALNEITIKWKEIIKEVGTSKTSKTAGVCGWGGTDFGKGHEIGLLVNLGDELVKVKDFNLRIRKHSFDTIVFRLHIRQLENGLPTYELLSESIYLPITKPKGWQKFDLSAYNILLKGKVAVSIEWIKISKVMEKNLIKMNGSKVATPNVLFDMNGKKGTLYTRRGSAAKWRVQEKSSPGFYITIKE
ncbi:carboxypeptidase-like regulatory domain-containing protein [Carboxylicivirga sp. N1Y90]|uniref:carboxypeptidase-like regulatory domain-containing protein n=1 Tax=Carboxylicivirga fragile TaxID=3417571 RepID=UPI003D326AD9|nr:carboxypeptidase-like regulatory domain-containing protein [Marinilabiliaceae bacterium N1Y90]